MQFNYVLSQPIALEDFYGCIDEFHDMFNTWEDDEYDNFVRSCAVVKVIYDPGQIVYGFSIDIPKGKSECLTKFIFEIDEALKARFKQDMYQVGTGKLYRGF